MFESTAGEQIVSPATDTKGNGEFEVALQDAPSAGSRAFLVYELAGLPHFTAARRAINGGPVQGGFQPSWGSKGGLQVEEVSPRWFAAGRNVVHFFPGTHTAASYRVRKLRLVVIPSAAAGLSPETNRTWGDLLDRSDTTVWTTKAGSKDEQRTWRFSARSQARALDFRLPKKASGELVIAAESRGDAGRVRVRLDGLTPGWHQVALDSLPVADRLVFLMSGGREAGASIAELSVSASPLPTDMEPHMNVTFPLSGECVNHRVHVQGFIDPPAAATDRNQGSCRVNRHAASRSVLAAA